MLQPLVQGGFQVPDALFLRSVVAGKVWRVIQWQNTKAVQNGIHRLAVTESNLKAEPAFGNERNKQATDGDGNPRLVIRESCGAYSPRKGKS